MANKIPDPPTIRRTEEAHVVLRRSSFEQSFSQNIPSSIFPCALSYQNEERVQLLVSHPSSQWGHCLLRHKHGALPLFPQTHF